MDNKMGKINIRLDYENKTLNEIVEVYYKHIPFGCKFEYEGQEYKKTNHARGFYHLDGRMIFKNFPKTKIVKTSREFFLVVPLTK